MCFLPHPLLKLLVGVGALVSCIMSIAILGITIYANVEKSEIIDNTDKQYVNDFLVAMYVISIFFLFLSVSGMYGTIKIKRKSASKVGNCLLSAYSIGVIVFAATFLVCTIVFFAAPPSILGESCQKGSKTQIIANLYKLSEEADENFCTPICPCYLNTTNITQSDLGNWLLENNKTVETEKTDKNFVRYQQCLQSKDQEGDALLMGSIEQFLGCGGWCSNNNIPKFPRFTDINDCQDKKCYENKKCCYQQFRNFMLNKGELLGIVTSIATGICFANVILICCLCYHPQNKGRKVKNFYARMMD